MADTPNIHLSHGDDADTNRNWDILDATIKALGLRTIIPDNVLIQGNLEVTGNALIDGILTANAIVSNSTLTAPSATLTQAQVGAGGLAVTGPTALAPGTLDGAALMKGATVQAVALPIANTNFITLSPTSTVLNTLTMPAAEELGRYELLFAQITFSVQYSPVAGVNSLAVQGELLRGTTSVQARTLQYTSSTASDIIMQSPLTMVRIEQVTDVSSHVWTLKGSAAAQPATGGPTAAVAYSQMYGIQFR